jgi:hypothetical protein
LSLTSSTSALPQEAQHVVMSACSSSSAVLILWIWNDLFLRAFFARVVVDVKCSFWFILLKHRYHCILLVCLLASRMIHITNRYSTGSKQAWYSTKVCRMLHSLLDCARRTTSCCSCWRPKLPTRSFCFLLSPDGPSALTHHIF